MTTGIVQGMILRSAMLALFLGSILVAQAAPLVTSEAELVAQLKAGAENITIGRNIILTADIPQINRRVFIRGSARHCKSRRCYIAADYKRRHFLVGTNGFLLLRHLSLRRGAAATGGSVYVTAGGRFHAYGVEFIYNHANGPLKGGGAIEVGQGSRVRALNSLFVRNSAPFGGAVDVAGAGLAHIVNCNFHNNTAALAGGALSLVVGAQGYVSRSAFSVNRGQIGGAIYVDGSNTTLCYISTFGNAAPTAGSAFAVLNGGVVTTCGVPRAKVQTIGTGKQVEACGACSR